MKAASAEHGGKPFPYGEKLITLAQPGELGSYGSSRREVMCDSGWRPSERPSELRHVTSFREAHEFRPMFQQVVDLVVGRVARETALRDRLDAALELLVCSDRSPECERLQRACAKAMIEAGVESRWVEADYDNIDELLTGNLGPVP